MMVGFRRECANPRAKSQPADEHAGAVPETANIMPSPYARLSAADLAAFKVYLDSPGATEVVSARGRLFANQVEQFWSRATFDR
jgi:hypothetical protein